MVYDFTLEIKTKHCRFPMGVHQNEPEDSENIEDIEDTSTKIVLVAKSIPGLQLLPRAGKSKPRCSQWPIKSLRS